MSTEQRALTVVQGSSPREDAKMPDYEVIRGAMHFNKVTRGGIEIVKLCNFNARILEETILDDGKETKRYFRISGSLSDGTPLQTVELPVEEFQKMAWIPRDWGAKAIISVVPSVRDHVRAAMQEFSGDVPKKVIYTHLGWRKIANEWVFLNGDKVIGGQGVVGDISVSLENGSTESYQIPNPPEGEELIEAIRASLRLLDLAPDEVTAPVLAATYRAPLGEAAVIDFSVFLAAVTGCQKTELSAMAQAHFGKDFHGNNLPGSWSSTANFLEKQAFILKDAVFVVDDFHPEGSAADISQLHAKADRLLRAQGNSSGRGRMNPDASLKQTFYPRGLIIGTGEDIPKGHSLQARMFILEMTEGTVDLKILTEVQRYAASGLLAKAMSAYIKWVAPQIDRLREELPRRIRENSTQIAQQDKYSHDRVPDIVASLMVGGESFLRFARESGAVDEAQQQVLSQKMKAGILKAAESQSSIQEGEDCANRFMDLLRSIILTGKAHLVDADSGGRPTDAQKYGWKQNHTGWVPSGAMIGWVSEDDVYLEPEAAYAAVQRAARSQDSSFNFGQRTAHKRLAERGLLKSRDTTGNKNTVRRMINGKRLRVLHLDGDVLLDKCPKGPE